MAFTCRIIAEVSSNHAGDMELAKRFIHVAADIGIDTVKFQSSRYEDLVDKKDPQGEWIKKSSLRDEDHLPLIEECKKRGVRFLTTCFSRSRVDFLSLLGMDEIKIASPDLLSFSLIEELAGRFRHLIISAGMHSVAHIREAIRFLEKNKVNATLMHSVSLYPTPPEKAFMSKFLWLKDSYPRVGYSNHCASIEPVLFAIANGACMVEAHLKLGKEGPGRAMPWDVLPEDFARIVAFHNACRAMQGEKSWLDDEDFLFPEEQQARKRFIGRWGDNR
jgi:N,N'-diacetyllegionaminate synthase